MSAKITAIEKKRYYLFTSEPHENVRLDFTNKTIDRFLTYWEAGETYEAMCGKLKVSEVELSLIAIDLQYTGRLPKRENGFWGVLKE